MEFKMFEIDLLDLCLKLLKKWKILILICLIGMFFGGVFSVVSKKAVVVNTNQNNSSIATAAAELSEAERNRVEDNYSLLVSLSKQKKNISDRIDSSIFFNLTLDKDYNYESYYYLETSAEGDALVNALPHILINDEMFTHINEKLENEISFSNLEQLISIRVVEHSTDLVEVASDRNKVGNMLLINIYGKEKDFCEIIYKEIKNELLKKIDSLKKNGENITCKELDSSFKKIDASAINIKYKNYTDMIYSINNSIITIKNSMSEKELSYYNALINGSMDNNNDVQQTKTQINKVKVAKLMIVFGILFCMIYILLFVVKYIFGGRLHNVNYLKLIFGINTICEVTPEKIDTALQELKYLYDDEREGKLAIASSCSDHTILDLIDSIKNVDKDNMLVKIKTRPETESDFLDLKQVKSIVIFEKEEQSKVKNISEMITYYMNKNIDIAGVILVK